MKRWINTRVVTDMETGEILEREGYWYDGPMALCDLGSLANIAMIGSMGTGMVGNIMNAVTRGEAISSLQSAENKYANMSPQKLASMVSGATAPLNQNLIESVNNAVQGDMAQRGLAQAPGIFAAEEEQALAPYEQQNQQTALQLILQKMGIPLQYASAILQGTQGGGSNLSPLLMMMLLRNNLNPSSPGITNTPSPWDDSNVLNIMFPPAPVTLPTVDSGGGTLGWD